MFEKSLNYVTINSFTPMRKTYLFVVLTLLPFLAVQAQIVSVLNDIRNDRRITLRPQGGQRAGTATCSVDTVLYPQAKNTNLRGITLNATSSASKLAQYYDAPQAMTIHGFEFYAWSPASSNASNTPVTLTCNLYYAGFDSLPSGGAIATATVTVDTVFGGGNLQADLRKVANFSSAVTVTGPYILSVETSSAISVAMVTNDWDSTDGQGEYLADIGIGSTWYRNYNINVGGVPFDADVLCHPYASYTLEADFSASPGCLTSPGTVSFTNGSSPVITNRMYNQAAYLAVPEQSFTWNYGDGSPVANAVSPTHAYSSAGAYTVTLRDTMFQWSGLCVVDTSFQFQTTSPTASFTGSGPSLTQTFTDGSSAANSWLWDFGDGSTSTLQNPSHTYSVGGVYTVCLTVTNPCGTDSSCQIFSVACQTPIASFSESLIAVGTYQFTDLSTAATSWSWDFGDGFGFSSVQNPTYNYSTPGTYTVTLIVTNVCGADTITQQVTVTCPPPTGGFTYNVTGTSVTFTNTSVLGSFYSWTFGDGNTSVSQNPSHTYASGGTYTVTLIVSNVCGADTIVQQVNVSCPVPVSTFTWSATGFNVNFTDMTTNSPTFWNWNFGDGNTSNFQNPAHTYATAGTYLVRLIATNSCGQDTVTDSVQIIIIGINEPDTKSVTLYPNPAENSIKVGFEGWSGLEGRIRIMDVLGRELESRGSRFTAEEEFSLGHLPAGLYLLEANSGTARIVKRFEIRR